MEPLFGDNYSFFPQRLVCSNLSDDTVTDIFGLPEVYRPYHLSQAVIFLLFLVVGLPWNFLVIIITVKERLYKQPTIILLLNLVVTDFLALLFRTSRIVTGFAGKFILGGSDQVSCEICRVMLIIQQTLTFSVILTVVLISFDRFLYIHKPLKYEKLVTVRTTLLGVAILWVLCMATALMYFAVLRHIFVDYLLMGCDWDIIESDHKYFHTFSILFILVSYVFLLVCNVWVVGIVVRNIRAVYKVEKSSRSFSQKRRISVLMLNQQMRRHRMRRQLHLMRVFGGLILADTVSWLPLVVLAVFSFFPVEERRVTTWYTTAASALFSSQFVLHPILEATLIKEIRVPLFRMLTCRCYGKRRNAGRISSADIERSSAVSCRCCHDDSGILLCSVFRLVSAALSSSIVDSAPPGKGPDHAHQESAGHTPPNEDTTEHAHNENPPLTLKEVSFLEVDGKESAESAATAISMNCDSNSDCVQYQLELLKQPPSCS